MNTKQTEGMNWGILLLYNAALLAVCIIVFEGKPMDWFTITFLVIVWLMGISLAAQNGNRSV